MWLELTARYCSGASLMGFPFSSSMVSSKKEAESREALESLSVSLPVSDSSELRCDVFEEEFVVWWVKFVLSPSLAKEEALECCENEAELLLEGIFVLFF